MADKKKVKNGTSFWWQRHKHNSAKMRFCRFRKLASVKDLVDNLRKSN